jgi:hypothetical protein
LRSIWGQGAANARDGQQGTDLDNARQAETLQAGKLRGRLRQTARFDQGRVEGAALAAPVPSLPEGALAPT